MPAEKRSNGLFSMGRSLTPAHLDLESLYNMNISKNAPWHEILPFGLIDASLGQVCEVIARVLVAPSSASELVPILGHLSGVSGKMIRPGLLLLAGQCFGPVTEEHVKVAAMMEMIHGATLLHDDVIDDGQTRRGLPTVNRLWGNESAVLLGDYILSQIFVMAAELESPIARVVAETAACVCAGELRQVAQKHNWQLKESQYIAIIGDKSAAFFSGCCRLGAMLSGAAPDQVEAVARYGMDAGIAFQIADDLLDIAGQESRTGKTSQCDLAKSKLTLAAIHLVGTVGPSDRDAVYAMLDRPAESASELKKMLIRHGSLDYAQQRARHYVQLAMEALDAVAPGEARDALIEMAGFMADRSA